MTWVYSILGRYLLYRAPGQPVQIRVECYSGYQADERPLRFFLGERCLEVKEVLDQWYSPGSSYFRVKGVDDNIYVIRNRWEEEACLWTLEAFRREAS